MSIKSLLFLAAFAVPTPSFADEFLDECIVGIWRVDLEDFAHVYAAQMGATSATATGDVRMSAYDNGNVNMSIRNLVINLQMPDMPAMEITVNGDSLYVMSTEGNTFTATTNDFDLVASADVLGQPMTIPVSSDTGLFGGGTGIFGCTADSLSFETPGDIPKIPRHWIRIE